MFVMFVFFNSFLFLFFQTNKQTNKHKRGLSNVEFPPIFGTLDIEEVNLAGNSLTQIPLVKKKQKQKERKTRKKENNQKTKQT